MKNFPSRAGLPLVVCSCLFLFSAAKVAAQTTYEWISGVQNADWATSANWDITAIPGSNFSGAFDDVVTILNNSAGGGNRNTRLSADAGTIGELRMGGEGDATSTQNAQLQMRAGSSLVVSGTTFIGQVGPFSSTARNGQINMNNGTTSLTLNDVVSNSTGGGNLIQTDAGVPTLFLNGDIDTSAVRAAAGVLPAGDDFEIDLRTNDANAIVFAAGGQVINVENFDVTNTGANNRNGVQTVPAGVTINALASEIGRVSRNNNDNRTVSGVMNVEGATINVTNDVRLGHSNHALEFTAVHTMTATLNVGDISGTIGGTINVGDELRLGQVNDNSGDDVSNSTVNVRAAGAVLNVADGVLMGTGPSGTMTATVIIDDGLAMFNGPITDSTLVTSEFQVFGGELQLLSAEGGARMVDTLTHDGGTIDFLALGSNPPLDTTDTFLSAGPGGSVFDITTPPADTVSSLTDTAVAVAPGPWQTPATWDTSVVPAQSSGVVSSGQTLTLVTSDNAIFGDAAAAVIGNSDGGWTLSQNANDVSITRTGAGYGAGPALAVIDTTVAVTSAFDLSLQSAAGQSADATGLLISAGSLDLTGGSSLTLGGVQSNGVVTQDGGAVTVDGNLLFGGTGGNLGGTYNLNAGTIAVNGDILEGGAGALDPLVDGAQFQINSGVNPLAMTNGSLLNVQRFSVGQEDGSNATQTLGDVGTIDITTSGTFAVGTGTDAGSGATGTFTLGVNGTVDALNVNVAENGQSVGTLNINGPFTSQQRVYVAGGATGDADSSTMGTVNISSTGSLTVFTGNTEIGRDGNGFLNINGGSYLQKASNLVLGQGGGANTAGGGTVTIGPGSTVTIGDGDNGPGNSSININQSGGSITQTGGDLVVEQTFNLSNEGRDSSFTMSGGTLTVVGEDFNVRGGDGQDTITLSGTADITIADDLILNGGSNNLLEIIGGNVNLQVGDSLTGGASATILFNFDGTGISPIVPNVANLNGTVLDLTGTLPSTGSTTLIAVRGTAPNTNGTFAGIPEGGFFERSGQTFQITYVGGDGNDTVITAFAGPTVSIAADVAAITEGDAAAFTLTRTGPTTEAIDVEFLYTGSATDLEDFVGTFSVTIPIGVSTFPFSFSTSVDGEFEGCEVIVANIDFVDNNSANAEIGTPSSANVSLNDASVSPVEVSGVNQIRVGSGTVGLDPLVFFDPDGASYASTYDDSTAEPLYHFSGQSNTSVFSDGTPDDDGLFTTTGLTAALGYSLEYDFTPDAGDLDGTVMLWETGGTSNGTSLYLYFGVPHVLIKANGQADDAPTDTGAVPGLFTDLSFDDVNASSDLQDDIVVVPLSTNQVTPGTPVRIAYTVNMIGGNVGSVTHSVNGEATATTPLLGSAGNNNWVGNQSHSIAQAAGGGTGGSSNAGLGTPFAFDTFDNVTNGVSSVSCVRFWNSDEGSVTETAGSFGILTATFTISNWASTTDGIIPGLTDLGSGVYETTGDVPAIVTALANLEFIESTATYPVTIGVSISDGNSAPLTGSILLLDVQPDPIYVDDAFAGSGFMAPIVDGDDGVAGNQSAVFGIDAFANLTDALGVISTTATVIVNDGFYLESPDLGLAPNAVLQLTGSLDTPGTSIVTFDSLSAAATNAINLGAEELTVGNDAGDQVIAAPISGTGNLTKVGLDTLILTGTNTYTGTTFVLDGILRVGDNVTAGALDGDGPISNDGTLQIRPPIDSTVSITNVISGIGLVATQGDGTTIFDNPGANTFSGVFELGDGGVSSFDGVDVGDKQGFTVVNRNDHLGTGDIRSRGSQLQAGTPGVVIPNNINVDGGGFRTGGDIDFELSGNVNPLGATRGYGNYGLEGLDVTISGGIVLTDGNANVEGSPDKDNGNWFFTGDISGTVGGVNVTGSFDDGEVTISGTNTYAGNTIVSAGTAFLTGNHTGGGNYTVNATGTLAGDGSTDSNVTVNAGGKIAPGLSPGILSTGSLTIRGEYEVEIQDTTMAPGPSGYSQIDVTGTVDVSSATLSIVESAGAVLDPATLTIINNDGADAVIPEFTGLPEGAIVPRSAGGSYGTITYGDPPSFPVSYNESIDGDLSTDPAAPTPLAFDVGVNSVTGSVSTGTDTRDYITFTIPAGQSLDSLLVQDYDDLGTAAVNDGNRGFHAINLGNTSFIPSGGTIGSFLGSDHLDPPAPGTDLLPTLGAAPQGGTGFSPPLGPGTYSYVIQQTGPQDTAYTIEFVISNSASTGNDVVIDFDLVTDPDADDDGIVLVLETAFDTNPSDPTSGREGLPRVEANATDLIIKFRQLNSPGSRQYIVQQSSDAATWITAPGVPSVSSDQSFATGNTMIMELAVPKGGPPRLLYLRLLIIE